MFAKEAELVDEAWVASENTYNIRIGGLGGWDYVNRAGLNNEGDRSLGHKAISAALTGRTNPRLTEWLKVQHALGAIRHDTFRGKRHTAEAKEKIASKMRVKQSGSLNSSFGTCWVHNPNTKEVKKIRKEDLAANEVLGFKRGRKITHTDSAGEEAGLSRR